LRHRNGNTVFERGDRVLDYWLVHSEGFSVVRGSARRRVGGVVVDPADGRARTLLVRGDTRGRSRSIAAASVVAVDPFEKVLYLERRSPAVARAAGRAGKTSAVRVGGAAQRLGGGGRRTAAWLLPRAQTYWCVAVRFRAALTRRAQGDGARYGRAAADWSSPRVAAGARSSAAACARCSAAARRHARSVRRRWVDGRAARRTSFAAVGRLLRAPRG
jgi:hypothetical protein